MASYDHPHPRRQQSFPPSGLSPGARPFPSPSRSNMAASASSADTSHDATAAPMPILTANDEDQMMMMAGISGGHHRGAENIDHILFACNRSHPLMEIGPGLATGQNAAAYPSLAATDRSPCPTAALERVPFLLVTRENFDRVYPRILASIQAADFLALDCELSGLGDLHNVGYIDFLKRFLYLKDLASSRAIVSLGISTFRKFRTPSDGATGSSSATASGSGVSAIPFLVDNFHLLVKCEDPYHTDDGARNFLRAAGFDFEYHGRFGIPYRRHSKAVRERNFHARPSSPLKSGLRLDDDQEFPRGPFNDSGNGHHKNPEVGPQRRRRPPPPSLRYSIDGIFEAIRAARRPIITHNGLLDLLFVVDCFWTPLARCATVSQFFAVAAQLLPGGIYDTKWLVTHLLGWNVTFLELVFYRLQLANLERIADNCLAVFPIFLTSCASERRPQPPSAAATAERISLSKCIATANMKLSLRPEHFPECRDLDLVGSDPSGRSADLRPDICLEFATKGHCEQDMNGHGNCPLIHSVVDILLRGHTTERLAAGRERLSAMIRLNGDAVHWSSSFSASAVAAAAFPATSAAVISHSAHNAAIDAFMTGFTMAALLVAGAPNQILSAAFSMDMPMGILHEHKNRLPGRLFLVSHHHHHHRQHHNQKPNEEDNNGDEDTGGRGGGIHSVMGFKLEKFRRKKCALARWALTKVVL